MFSYYGSKANVVHLYPPPKYGKIIEPFAGSARYSLRYFDREVVLVDKYKVLFDIWKYLQSASEKDILSMPRQIKNQVKFETIIFECEEQKNLFSFLCGCADATPRNMATKRKTIDRPNTINYRIQQLANNLHKIRHWKIIHGSFEELKNEEATWFIDPPYQVGGYVYKENKVDYEQLAEWSRDRKGQVIVCENTKADWMTFYPIKTQRGSNKKTTEAIWTNIGSSFKVKQKSIF